MTAVESTDPSDTSLEQIVAASRGQFRTVEEMAASVIRTAIASGMAVGPRSRATTEARL